MKFSFKTKLLFFIFIFIIFFSTRKDCVLATDYLFEIDSYYKNLISQEDFLEWRTHFLEWEIRENTSIIGPSFIKKQNELNNHIYYVYDDRFLFFNVINNQEECFILLDEKTIEQESIPKINFCHISNDPQKNVLLSSKESHIILNEISTYQTHSTKYVNLMLSEDIVWDFLKNISMIDAIDNKNLPKQISARIYINNTTNESKKIITNLFRKCNYILLYFYEKNDFYMVLFGRLVNHSYSPLKIVWDGRHLDWTSAWWGRPGLPWTSYCNDWFPRLKPCHIILYDDPEWNYHLSTADAIIRWPGYNLDELPHISSLSYPSKAIIYLTVGESLHQAGGLFQVKTFENMVHFEEPWIQIARSHHDGSNNIVLMGLVPKMFDQNHLWAWESNLVDDFVRKGHFAEVPGYHDRKGPELCFVSSHCGVPFRDDMINALKSIGITVEGYGKCFHSPDPSIQNRCNNDKSCLQKSYRFCLIIENSDSPGYHTEKIYDALRDGCIPVYWANSDALDFMPSDESVILIRDYLNNLSALKAKIEMINADPHLWHSFLNWRSSPPDWFNIVGLSSDLLGCHVCHHLNSRIHLSGKVV